MYDMAELRQSLGESTFQTLHYISHSIPPINGPMSRPIGDTFDKSESGSKNALNSESGPDKVMC